MRRKRVGKAHASVLSHVVRRPAVLARVRF